MNKLEAAVLEVKELTHYNQHAEAIVEVAEYICEKHFNHSDATKLRAIAKRAKQAQDEAGYLSPILSDKRKGIISTFKHFLNEAELKAFTEVM